MERKACGEALSFDIIKDNVKHILLSTERFLSLKENVVDYMKRLVQFLPENFKLKPENMSYVDSASYKGEYRDPKTGFFENEHPISMLKSPRNSFFKGLDETGKLKVSNMVDACVNASRRMDQEFGDAKIHDISMRIYNALTGRDDERLKMAEKIIGVHKIDENYELLVSCDPFDILMKSTAQEWEMESCERYGGEYFDGVFSDIQNVSVIAFVFDEGLENAIARIMLRPCTFHVIERGPTNPETNTSSTRRLKKWGYGIEKYYYSIDGQTLRRSNKTLGDKPIKAIDVTKRIESLLKEKGLYGYETETCTTPFTYTGYSDVMHRGNTVIHYSKSMEKCEECGAYYSPSIMRDGRCPSCRGD